MNETMVTLQGYVGGPVKLRQAGDSLVANFRVACTPRRYNRRTQEWFDADTQWYTVNAWRVLGDHCSRSLTTGDPVVVHGESSAPGRSSTPTRWRSPRSRWTRWSWGTTSTVAPSLHQRFLPPTARSIAAKRAAA